MLAKPVALEPMINCNRFGKHELKYTENHFYFVQFVLAKTVAVNHGLNCNRFDKHELNKVK